jgi:hypothetical protein
MDTYDQGIERLVNMVSQMNSGARSGWSTTPLKQEIQGLAKRLIELADDLEQGKQSCFDIEEEHDKEPLKEIGSDGMPLTVENWHCSYQATLMHMRALAISANRVANSFPDSRSRRALPFAAMGLLRLKSFHNQQIGAIATTSPVVLELSSICNAAGICIEDESIRNALRLAFDQFNQSDRDMYPPGTWEVISGG